MKKNIVIIEYASKLDYYGNRYRRCKIISDNKVELSDIYNYAGCFTSTDFFKKYTDCKILHIETVEVSSKRKLNNL